MKSKSKTLIEQISEFSWYQTIPLGENVSTPGETGDAGQKKLEMMALPEDLSGQRVLDIGCNEGFFAFEAERRKAEHVIAVDKGTAARKKFEFVKQVLGSNVDFLKAGLLELDPDQIGRFDVVFFLSVLHHLRYPLLALDRVYKLTAGFVVLEAVEAVATDGRDVSALVRKVSRKGHLHMLPTRTFLLEILERAGFSNVEIMGTHREHRVKPERRMPGFSEQRVLLRAFG